MILTPFGYAGYRSWPIQKCKFGSKSENDGVDPTWSLDAHHYSLYKW